MVRQARCVRVGSGGLCRGLSGLGRRGGVRLGRPGGLWFGRLGEVRLV